MVEKIIESVITEMKDKNVKIADLCRATKLSRQTLDNIMNGRRAGINLGTLCKICSALNLQITLQKQQ